jgi:hypothetical protein
MKIQLQSRALPVLKFLIVAAALVAGAAAEAQLAVAGFAIGQELKSCPHSSVPMRKDAHDSGIACKFPGRSTTAFGAPADEVSLAADRSGSVESVVVMGIDAVQAASRAIEEYGSPDGSEVHDNASVWGWVRGDVQLVIFHNHGDQSLSNVILDRRPR